MRTIWKWKTSLLTGTCPRTPVWRGWGPGPENSASFVLSWAFSGHRGRGGMGERTSQGRTKLVLENAGSASGMDGLRHPRRPSLGDQNLGMLRDRESAGHEIWQDFFPSSLYSCILFFSFPGSSASFSESPFLVSSLQRPQESQTPIPWANVYWALSTYKGCGTDSRGGQGVEDSPFLHGASSSIREGRHT